jgi:flagellin-specific chaperone FliS
MNSFQNATLTYRMNQINGASPLDLLIMAYDAALASAGQGDLDRFTRAIGVLRDALDYSYDAEVALGFFRLYQYCADLARKGEFDEAAGLIRGLRDAWDQVRSQHQLVTAPAASPTPPPSAYSAPVSSYTMATAGFAFEG